MTRNFELKLPVKQLFCNVNKSLFQPDLFTLKIVISSFNTRCWNLIIALSQYSSWEMIVITKFPFNVIAVTPVHTVAKLAGCSHVWIFLCTIIKSLKACVILSSWISKWSGIIKLLFFASVACFICVLFNPSKQIKNYLAKHDVMYTHRWLLGTHCSAACLRSWTVWFSQSHGSSCMHLGM